MHAGVLCADIMCMVLLAGANQRLLKLSGCGGNTAAVDSAGLAAAASVAADARGVARVAAAGGAAGERSIVGTCRLCAAAVCNTSLHSVCCAALRDDSAHFVIKLCWPCASFCSAALPQKKLCSNIRLATHPNMFAAQVVEQVDAEVANILRPGNLGKFWGTSRLHRVQK